MAAQLDLDSFRRPRLAFSGNTVDSTTLRAFPNRIEQRYGRVNRIWVMARGIPTEDSLTKMRRMGASYLVAHPRGD